MKNEIETAMKALLEQISNATPPDAAMKFSQAVLNLAHASAICSNR